MRLQTFFVEGMMESGKGGLQCVVVLGVLLPQDLRVCGFYGGACTGAILPCSCDLGVFLAAVLWRVMWKMWMWCMIFSENHIFSFILPTGCCKKKAAIPPKIYQPSVPLTVAHRCFQRKIDFFMLPTSTSLSSLCKCRRLAATNPSAGRCTNHRSARGL